MQAGKQDHQHHNHITHSSHSINAIGPASHRSGRQRKAGLPLSLSPQVCVDTDDVSKELLEFGARLHTPTAGEAQPLHS
jgi:hypothetical protein